MVMKMLKLLDEGPTRRQPDEAPAPAGEANSRTCRMRLLQKCAPIPPPPLLGSVIRPSSVLLFFSRPFVWTRFKVPKVGSCRDFEKQGNPNTGVGARTATCRALVGDKTQPANKLIRASSAPMNVVDFRRRELENFFGEKYQGDPRNKIVKNYKSLFRVDETFRSLLVQAFAGKRDALTRVNHPTQKVQPI